MRSAHDRCACAVRRADHDGGRGDLADGGGLARDRKMDSRNCAARLTITQAEKSTARTNVCGTRVSGDPGAASFPGSPSAAHRCLTSISLGKMAPNVAWRRAQHGPRRAPLVRSPSTHCGPSGVWSLPPVAPHGNAGRRCRPNFFRMAGSAAPRIAPGATTRRDALRRARSAARVGKDHRKSGRAHTLRYRRPRMRTAAYVSSERMPSVGATCRWMTCRTRACRTMAYRAMARRAMARRAISRC